MRLGDTWLGRVKQAVFHPQVGRDRLHRGEASASRHINIVGHYAADTLLDKNGRLIKIIALAGIDALTQAAATLDAYKHQLNRLFKHFTSEYAVYFWVIRQPMTDYPAGDFPTGFAQQLDARYRENIQRTTLYVNVLSMAIVTKPPEGLVLRSWNFFKHLSHAVDYTAHHRYLAQQYEALQALTRKVVKALTDYQPTILGVYRKNGVTFSRPLEFVSQLLNFDTQPVPLAMRDASVGLPRKRLFFNRRSGTLEMRSANGRVQFAAVLAIKEYAPLTYQGILDGFSDLRISYVITQSFRFYDRQFAKSRLRDQQKERFQSKDESIRQTLQLDEAFDEAASGQVGYGAHHFTLVCYAKTQDELNHQVGSLIARFSEIDITCVREDISCECGFWAQFPGNFPYIVRQADISTLNMAAFASLHHPPIGQRAGNHWGPAVTVLETLSGSPYYFNFHYKDVGNFLVVGRTGSGKTVLVGFLLAQSMKFGGKRVIFDKDRGLEILVRALAGVYEPLRPGIPTGFNPCQLEDNVENRTFLSVLLKKLLTPHDQPLGEAEAQAIERAMDGLYRLKKADRQFSHLAPFLGTLRPGSLRARFEKWHSGHEHAWLFDNPTDSFQDTTAVIGIDLTFILKDEACKVPTLMYLLHRFSALLEGQRGLIFIDEGWLALEDDYFKRVINDLSRTPRKKNNFFGLATQAGSDMARSARYAPISEAAACKFFFPNPSADRAIYVDAFGLSETEFELIKTLPDEAHYCLLHYGYGKASVVVRPCLDGLDDALAVISARKTTLTLLDAIRTEVGDDPAVWLPIFHAHRRDQAQQP